MKVGPSSGQAEFWAGQCYGTYGSSVTDYRYEGNVAKALRALKSKCGTSDETWLKLRRNRNKIRSYVEHQLAHKHLYNC